MIVDARTLEDASTLHAEVCVIGAGPAGITVARRLADAGREVLLVESTATANAASTALNQGSIVGHPVHVPLEQTRRRALGGGSTAHWSGYCRTLPLQGWPSEVVTEVRAYEPVAHDLIRLGPVNYDPGYWAGVSGVAPPPALGTGLGTSLFQIKAKSFADYRPDLEASPHVTLLHDANVVSLTATSGGATVTAATARTLTGLELTLTADCFVVAAGALETTRLLLASTDAVPAGLGNQHDQVGRFFGDDVALSFGLALWSTPFVDLGLYRGAQNVATSSPDGSPTTVNLACQPSLPADVRTALGLPNIVFSGLYLDYAQTALAQSSGISPRHLAELMESAGTPAKTLVLFRVMYPAQPNPDSRVRLGGAVDALGMPRIELDWQLLPADLTNATAGLRHLGRCIDGHVMETFGWLSSVNSVLTITPTGDEPVLVPQTQFHHLGTTRMSALASDGVVDHDCRVHTTANLYVAGSSVFPVPQGDTPTLTIVALAARLADHLDGEVLA